MTINASLSAAGEELTICVDGRFDYLYHNEFRGAYEGLDRRPLRYLIDLKAVTHVDSSALGMLLLLRDYAGGDDANISIINGSEDVKKVLLISKFDQLFEIS